MKRITIYLDYDLDRRLVERARVSGRTKSALVREALVVYFAEFGSFQGGPQTAEARCTAQGRQPGVWTGRVRMHPEFDDLPPEILSPFDGGYP